MMLKREFLVYFMYISSEVVKCWGTLYELSYLYLYVCISCETLIFAFIYSCNSVKSGMVKCSQNCVCVLCGSLAVSSLIFQNRMPRFYGLYNLLLPIWNLLAASLKISFLAVSLFSEVGAVQLLMVLNGISEADFRSAPPWKRKYFMAVQQEN